MAEISFSKENLNILVTRADRIGDLVLSTPVISELRKRFPRARISALTFKENRQVLEGNPFLDEVILYDKKGAQKNLFGNWKFARMLSGKKFDAVIHLHATNRMHIVSRLAGIPVRIGWDRRAAWALTYVFPDTKKEGKKHEAEYNFDLLAPLGVKYPASLELYFPVTFEAEAAVRGLFEKFKISPDKPLIILSPSASCPSKRWPAERFGQLADALHSRSAVQFAAIGTEADRPLIQRLQASSRSGVLDLSGRLDLSMLGALLKHASLLISNDSGPAHIAAAVGTPVISIFGRRQPGLSPARWRPLGPRSRFIWKDVGCDPCLAHECQIHFLCHDVVSVEDVLKEIVFFDAQEGFGLVLRHPSPRK